MAVVTCRRVEGVCGYSKFTCEVDTSWFPGLAGHRWVLPMLVCCAAKGHLLRDLRQGRIASLGEREGICVRWWLSVMECVPNVKLIAKVNREFSAQSS